jgi:hypothetical protein
MDKIVSVFICIFGFFILPLGVQAQNDRCQCDSLHQGMFEPLLTGSLLESFARVSGDEYYYNWENADIRFVNGETAYNKLLRYNGFLNEMIWLSPVANRSIKLDKSTIREVYLKGPKITYRQMILPGSSDPVFVEVLLEGKASVYVYRKVHVSTTMVENNGRQNYAVDQLENVFEYYVKLPGSDSFVSVGKPGRRKLVRLFPDQKSTVRKIIREHNLTINSETEFAYALEVICTALETK